MFGFRYSSFHPNFKKIITKTTLNKLNLIQIAIDYYQIINLLKDLLDRHRPPPLYAFYFSVFDSLVFKTYFVYRPLQEGGGMRALPLEYYLCNANSHTNYNPLKYIWLKHESVEVLNNNCSLLRRTVHVKLQFVRLVFLPGRGVPVHLVLEIEEVKLVHVVLGFWWVEPVHNQVVAVHL